MQDVSKTPQRLTCGRRAGVGVDFHRDGLIGMPKDSHDHARVHIEADEQCGTSMPGVMNSDRTYSRGLAAGRELPVESAGISWGAVTTGEDQRGHGIRLLPDLAGSLSFPVLLCAPDPQCRGHDVRHGKRGIGCLGLRFPVKE